ncbi:hypothetical protein L211DRAFT_842571 [Terfezia boudieri ATCC MYA-4762]|uniref:MYND-type domain-containing protein n=1 Tax=Terfezia boudieri ATCC MYA-4762 TaxID=1051890 RepID=A0A3N4L9C2_9PEZI|nr:hypothetical protein L211DRAFT_842571 [Terfezia boudieri ATCC MYA-4762]
MSHPIPSRTGVTAHPCSRQNCEHRTATQLCGKCKKVWYCGRPCQTADWFLHKRRCPDLANGLLTCEFKRSPRLSLKQRDFLTKSWAIDLAVQNLIPGNTSQEWSVPETFTISPSTLGVLLSHQPLNDRFRWGHNSSLCKFLTGNSSGYIEIYPSGYDYDLTHTLYYIPERNPPRTVSTSELTIEGVELVGITQLDKHTMASFLEAVVGPARKSPVAYITSLGSRKVEDFIEPQINKKNTKYMHRPGLDQLDAKEREEYETLQRLRGRGLKLTSASETWVRECGMHWPEYFFGKREDNKELEYGKGPKFDSTWADYWKWMASKNS